MPLPDKAFLIAENIRAGKLKIDAALRMGYLPQRLLQPFGCDCTERVESLELKPEYNACKNRVLSPDERFFHSISLREQWLAAQTAEERVSVLWYTAALIAGHTSRANPGQTFSDERNWQALHLAELIELERQKPVITQWQVDTEDNVFE